MRNKIKDFFWPVREGERKLFWGIILIMVLYSCTGFLLLSGSWSYISGSFIESPLGKFIILLIFLGGYLELANRLRNSHLFVLSLIGFAVAFLISFVGSKYGFLSTGIFSLFFTLWITVGSLILIMQLVNMLFTTEQASRLYIFMAFMSLIINLGISYGYSLFSLNTIKVWVSHFIAIGSIVIMASVGYWLASHVLKDKKRDEPCKFPLLESTKLILYSSYILWMAVFLISFSLAKKALSLILKLNHNPMMGQEFFIYAMILSLFLIFLLKNVVQWLGWKKATLLITMLLLLCGVSYFEPVIPFFIAPQIYLIVGILKEILYVPLDKELRVKGKIFLDGVLVVGLIQFLNSPEINLNIYGSLNIYGAYFLLIISIGLLVFSILKIAPLYQKMPGKFVKTSGTRKF